jgi:hypothetical protein
VNDDVEVTIVVRMRAEDVPTEYDIADLLESTYPCDLVEISLEDV